jgi:hypothetical protein
MSLPPYDPNIYWKDFQIKTPTFELTPVEKPDMSPFLIHMTGKNAIEMILRGDGSPTPLSANFGFLRSSIPEYDQGIFNFPVVCFSESPTFALDFFRYRSFERWKKDERFGIGFRKDSLVQQGVRPVVYIDAITRGHLIYLYKLGVENSNTFSNDPLLDSHIKSLIKGLYPFLFPLLEEEPEQGYTWEREWRYPNSIGFAFPFESISVICSPEEEVKKITTILGGNISNIQFVNTWKEYDVVSSFLRNQQNKWAMTSDQIEQIENHQEKKAYLVENEQFLTNMINSLSSFDSFITDLDQHKERLDEERSILLSELDTVHSRISELEKILIDENDKK